MNKRIASALFTLGTTLAHGVQSPEEMRREVEAGFIQMKAEDAAKKQGTPIPRSAPGDKGRYFLLEARRKGDVVYAVSKRVGLESTDYSKTETNCVTRQMREVGVSAIAAEKINNKPTKWFELVPGSSKSDLAHFVCNWPK